MKSTGAKVAQRSEARAIIGELYVIKLKVKNSLHRITETQASLQQTGQELSGIASRLRDLLQAQAHRSPWAKPANEATVSELPD